METRASSAGSDQLGHTAGRLPAWRRWALRLGPPLLIVLAGLAAYWDSFDGPFIYDDVDSIPKNHTIRWLGSPGEVLSPPRDGRTVDGRPVLNLSLALNYAVGKLNVRGYHLANLMIHLAAGLTLLGLVRRTLRLPVIPGTFRDQAGPLALAVALIWTVHPLTTAAVTYVVQRAESMMGLLYLLALYGAVRAWEARRPIGWTVAAVAACALGMATKETMVTAPLAVILYDRVFLASSFRQALRRRWMLYAGLAATWGLLALLMVRSGGRGGTLALEAPMAWWEYAGTQFGFVVRYLWLSFWPGPLVFDYGQEVAKGFWEIAPYALVIAILLAGAGVALRYRPRLAYPVVWVFLVLAPTSSVAPLATQTGAEYRMYLALAGVVSFVVLAGYWAWRRLVPAPAGAGGRRMHVRRIVPLAALAAIVTATGVRTYVRNTDYRTDLSIWQDTVDKWPGNPRGHQNLAWALVAAGDLDRAMAEVECSVRLNPSYLRALVTRAAIYGVRGGLYQDAGRFAEAWSDYARGLEDCTRVITLRPDEADAYNNRGEIFRRRGTLLRAQGRSIAGTHPKEAAELYDRACQDFTSALNDLHVAIRFRRHDPSAYGKRGAASLDLAVTCREALVLKFGRPTDLRPVIYKAFTQALFDCDMATQTEDAPAQTYFALANAYAEFGSYLRLTGEDPGEYYLQAIRNYTQAIKLAPTMAEAYENRAAAYEAVGQPVPAGLDRAQAARLRSR